MWWTFFWRVTVIEIDIYVCISECLSVCVYLLCLPKWLDQFWWHLLWMFEWFPGWFRLTIKPVLGPTRSVAQIQGFWYLGSAFLFINGVTAAAGGHPTW